MGNGCTTDQSTPIAVSNITNATAVSAGLYYTCEYAHLIAQSNAGEVLLMVSMGKVASTDDKSTTLFDNWIQWLNLGLARRSDLNHYNIEVLVISIRFLR